MAGNPPADAAQPFGINGMIVTVAINEKHEPMAPRIPSFLFQNPESKSALNNHSDTHKKRLAPRMPKTGYIQGDKRAVADVWDQTLCVIVKPFPYPKNRKTMTIAARTKWQSRSSLRIPSLIKILVRGSLFAPVTLVCPTIAR
jgi:hypothetical protein